MAVAARYARALADIVTKPGAAAAPDAVRAELGGFLDALESSEELRTVLANPAVAATQKRALIERLGQPLGLSRISLNFLFVLMDNRRIHQLGEVLGALGTMLDERLGIAQADVTTATELDEAGRGLMEQSLRRLTGKQVRARYSVDPSLVGGAVTRIGSTVYDGSVRENLRRIRERLSSES